MDILPATLMSICLLGYAAGALGGLALFRADRFASLCTFGTGAIAALCGLLAAALSLATGAATANPPIVLVPPPIPYVPFSVTLDPLGAFFVLIVSLLALAISIYSLGYARGFFARKNVAALGLLFNLLLLATTLVCLADNAFFFLIAWEAMALTAFCLVSFEHEDRATRQAGVLFFVMSHIGTGCLIVAFLLLFQASGDYSFAHFRAAAAAMSAGQRDLTFLLFLVGFGVKAGIVPLHIWLPAAHPVAPSNVSALMSAVLIKTGIYGIARVSFDFFGAPPMWWGVTVLAIGTVSALLGVLYALMEHDLKRLLAYHSIENIGIILMGFGAALMFSSTQHPRLAGLALLAGLFHTLNHAVFKGLLFLGAGAVLHATHTRNMEELGGLIKRMPATSLFFLIGAIAISALPPLNGFVSEWLTYQSLLQGFNATSSLARLMFPLSGALLALTGALAAACFVKAFGITFLAQPRSTPAREAHEASPTMLAGMGLLTAACVFLGLFPTTFFAWLDPLTQQLAGVQLSETLSTANGLVLGGLDPQAGTVSTPGILMIGLCLLVIPGALWLSLGSRARTQIGPTWACGQPGLTPQMQYTATGFSKPLRMIFRGLFRPRRAVQAEYEFSRYFARTIRFESHVEETFEKRIYEPLQRKIQVLSHRMRAFQAGSLQAYLIYIFVTLVLLLLFAL